MCVQVTGTQYTLLALNKYTEYALRVEANGKHGPGTRGDTLTVRTLSDVPTAAPQDVTAVATRCDNLLNTLHSYAAALPKYSFNGDRHR
jgi:neogenin